MEFRKRDPRSTQRQKDGRETLAYLMFKTNTSQRALADAIGWGSHSYLGRLLRGEESTLSTDAAVRIAHYFDVGVDDLFVPRSSTDGARAVHAQRTLSA